MTEPFPSQGIRNEEVFSERSKNLSSDNARSGANIRMRRKYPLELLNLAVERAKEIGLAAASEELGIPKKTIDLHGWVKKIEKQKQGVVAFKPRDYARKHSIEVQRAIIIKAHEIRKETNLPIKTCFDHAARPYGANGKSIYSQFVRGTIQM